MSTTTIVARDGTRTVLSRTRAPPVAAAEGPAARPVGWYMSAEVTGVEPEVALDDLVVLFVEHGIGALPIVDREGRPAGIVTKSDVLRVQCGARAGRRAVDVGSIHPRTLPRDAPIWEAAAIMAAHRLHHLIIADDDGVLLGVLSALDVVRWMAEAEGWGLSSR